MFFRSFSSTNTWILIAAFLGILTGMQGQELSLVVADTISAVFMNILKLLSLPMIFLSVVATVSGMEGVHEVRHLGLRALRYTLLTTIAAAAVALGVFLCIDPVRGGLGGGELPTVTSSQGKGYLTYLLELIPANILSPFLEGNVLGILFLAVSLSLGILSLPKDSRVLLHNVFSGLFAAIMNVTQAVVKLMPLAIWAFVTLFVKELQGELALETLFLYLACVVGANLVQAFIVLPLLLKWKGISPWTTARGMSRALYLGFLSRSTSAVLPVTMQCMEQKLKVDRKVSRFTLPLCATINMNACAGFILITVLFVSMSYGVTFSPAELIGWVFIATLAAAGNAAVPMGCYFVASAFLAAMDVPLAVLGVILPVYSLLDMLETAINIWSDSCVTAVVAKELGEVEEVNGKEVPSGALLQNL